MEIIFIIDLNAYDLTQQKILFSYIKNGKLRRIKEIFYLVHFVENIGMF